MPLVLVIPDAPERRIPLDGRPVVVGRAPACAARLADASVDERHLVLELVDGAYVAIDQGSSSGSSIGGVRLRKGVPRIVRSGDVLRVGNVRIALDLDDTAFPSGLDTREIALRAVDSDMNRETVPLVRIVEGPNRGDVLRLAEDGRAYVVGRAAACDLLLRDSDASREHARLRRDGQRVLVRDLGSRQRTILGPVPLRSGVDAVWEPSTRLIRVASSILGLEMPAPSRVSRLADMIDDEPMPPEPELVAAAPAEADEPNNPDESNLPKEPVVAAEPDIASSPNTTSPIAAAPSSAPVSDGKRASRTRSSERVFVVTALVLLVAAVVAIGWILIDAK